MSLLKSGSKLGKFHFGDWDLLHKSNQSSIWQKCNYTSGYIQISYYNTNYTLQKYDTNIYFAGEVKFLEQYFKKFRPDYENRFTDLEFTDVQAAKDYIDNFINRMNKLLAFI